MSEIRKNLVKNKWVAVAAHRALKPNDFPIAKKELEVSAVPGFCPFCEGNESFTPAEISAWRGNSEANTTGWSVRVIPNKFSAFALEGDLSEKHLGIYSFYNGLGQHEVIIENPAHGVEFHELNPERVEIILQTFKNRYQDLCKDERIKYIQIYKNRGMFAGASLEHSHSQIVALPFAPNENAGLTEYFRENGSCLLCDMIRQESTDGERLVFDGEHFILLCPYAPRFPYETWIIPRRHSEHFGDINHEELKELASILNVFTNVIIDSLGNPSYNLVINTAPVNVSHEDGYHWFLEITPRLLVNAGVEIATGLFINPVAPELSAAMLREQMPAAEQK